MLLFEWKKRRINRLSFLCFFSTNFIAFHYITMKYIDVLGVFFILFLVIVYNYLNCLFSSQRLKDIGFIFYNLISITLNLTLSFLIYYSSLHEFRFIYFCSIFVFLLFILFMLVCPSNFLGKGK